MKADTRSFYVQAVQRSIEGIVGKLDEAVSLDAIAADACLSPFHFHRVFKGMTGETPVELARRLRFERAAWQLSHDDHPITRIAFEAGYEAHEAFTRAFAERYGEAPSAFRASGSTRVHLAATCGVHYDTRGAIARFTPRDSGGRSMQVELKEFPSLRLAAIRHVGPYNQINEAFGRLGAIAGRTGLFAHAGASMIAVYHDIPETTPPEQLRSDAGLTIPDGTSLPDGLTEQRIPGGRYAVTVHVGPYETLGDTWHRLMGEWLPASGHRFGSGPSYEVYLNDPTRTPKAELRTELRIPVD
jgi:AraC family transcriptional regulator